MESGQHPEQCPDHALLMPESVAAVGQGFAWKAVQLGAGQGLLLLRTLVLARLLAPDDFGLWAIALVTMHTVSSLSELGITHALIYKAQSEPEQYHAAWSLGLVRSILISLTLFALAPAIAAASAEPRSVALIRGLALYPLIESLASVNIVRLTIGMNFRSIALARLPAVAVDVCVAIALAGSLGVWAMVAGQLSGGVAYVVLSYIVAPWRPRLSMNMAAISTLFSYGRWITLSSWVIVIGGGLISVLISRRLGAAALGVYFLASRLAFTPNQIASNVVGEVAFPAFSRLRNDVVKSAEMCRVVVVATMALLTPLYAMLIVLAPYLARDVLGARWEASAPIIQILAVAGVVSCLTDAVIPIFKGLGHPRFVAGVESLQSLLLILLVWTLAGPLGVAGAAAAWIPATVAALVLAAVVTARVLPGALTGLLRPASAIVFTSICGALVALAMMQLVSGPAGLVAAGALGALVAAIQIVMLDMRFRLGVFRDVSSLFPQAGPLVYFVATRLPGGSRQRPSP
jgi:lipopolysaccharide exporter